MTLRTPSRSISKPVSGPPRMRPALGIPVISCANSTLSISSPNHGMTIAGRPPGPKCAAIIGMTGGVTVKMSDSEGAEDSMIRIAAHSFSRAPVPFAATPASPTRSVDLTYDPDTIAFTWSEGRANGKRNLLSQILAPRHLRDQRRPLDGILPPSIGLRARGELRDGGPRAPGRHGSRYRRAQGPNGAESHRHHPGAAAI